MQSELRSLPALGLLAGVLVCVSGTVRASVHVVNGGSGSALQGVIDSAASGDTIVVHNGSFGAIQVAGKALTILSEPTLSTTVQGLSISNLAAGQATTITGLRVTAPAYAGGASIPECVVVSQCAGSVRLSNVTATVVAPNGSPALRATQSQDVALYACDLRGSDGTINSTLAFLSPPYGEGVRSTQSRIAAYETIVRGGDGMNGFTQSPCSTPFVWFPTNGGHGVSIDAASTWFSSGGSITGGRGGNGVPARCDCFTSQLVPGSNGASGGSAVDNANGAAGVVIETVLSPGVAGAGGLPSSCTGTPAGGGAAGAAGVSSTNPISTLSGPRVRISGPTVVRAGQTLTLTLQGAAGDLALLGHSFDARWVPIFGANGVLLIGPSGRRAGVGTFSGAGTMTFQIPAGFAVPGTPAEQWRLQAFGYPLSGIQVGAGWEVTVLDPQY